MTAPRPICVNCGKPYGVRATRDEVSTRRPDGSWPPYRGNGIVMKDFRIGDSATRAYRTIWDGETWRKPYEPFCKLRCALDYARKVYKQRHSPKEPQ